MKLKIFDINYFLRRNNLTFAELAKKINCTPGLIGMWASRRAFPSFDKCVRLIKLGMTFEEMFGTEIFENVELSSTEKKKGFENKNEFEKKVYDTVVKFFSSGAIIDKIS